MILTSRYKMRTGLVIVEARDIMENGVCLCVYAFFQFILLFIAILRNKAYNEQIRQIVIAEVMAT